MALREDLDLTKTMNFSQMSSLVYILFWLEDIKLLNDMFEVVLSLGPHLTERTKRVDVIIEILPHLYNIQDIFSILQGVCTSTRLSCLEINKILQSCVYLPEHMQLNVIDCVFNVFHHQMDSDFYEPSNILQLVDDCLFRYNCCVERSALLHAKVVEILMLKSPQIEKVMLEHIDADVLHPFKKFLNSRINSDNENAGLCIAYLLRVYDEVKHNVEDSVTVVGLRKMHTIQNAQRKLLRNTNLARCALDYVNERLDDLQVELPDDVKFTVFQHWLEEPKKLQSHNEFLPLSEQDLSDFYNSAPKSRCMILSEKYKSRQ
mgnify:FL=1